MNINEKKLKILRVLYSILCVTIGICVIVFSAIIYTNIKKNNAIFDGLLENWENDPIINLHIKSNPDEECSNRNDSLFFYFWPGTIAGCDCTIFGPLNSRCCDAADILLNKTEHCCIGKEIKE